MEMYFVLANFCLVHFCSAQNSTAFTEKNENIEFNRISIDGSSRKDYPPSFHWKAVSWPTRNLPSDAVFGGIDSPSLCGKVYVGRAWYNGNLLPAKICGSDGRAFVAYHGTEVMLNESEVLCSENALWKPVKEARIPKRAFAVSHTKYGEALYVGRWFVNLQLTPGKVEEGSGTLQMTYGQRIYRSSQYEILMIYS